MKNTPGLYQLIRTIFRFIGGTFYATTECHGLDDFPADGKPTILCFNHGNGLADPLVLIRKTNRMVRFCAKDSLWSTPVMKYFIRNSGAVPVYRSKDHGEKAKELNLGIFAKVIAALREGDCLGFVPEGVSRFLPYMEQPLKTGVARIAIDAVEQAVAAGQAEFAVQIVPVGLIFTHREKFRSDLCMRYRPAIVVDAAYLKPYGGVGSLDVKAAAVAITTSLNDALEEVTINAPDWETTRLAMTSARLHHPRGSDLTLGQYLILVRGWVEVLKSAPVAESADGAPALPAVGKLRAALAAYQDELDHRGIKCERVRRASIAGQALPWYWCVWGMVQRVLACAILFSIAAPGLLLWMPIWRYVKRQERYLLSKGPRWNDSVAEMKMMTCGLVGICFVVGCALAVPIFRSPLPPLLLAYLYVTMRCYEEGVADARSCYSLYKLLRLTPKAMRSMVELRTHAKAAIDSTMALLPTGVDQYMTLTADEARPSRTLDYYFPWWAARLIMLVARRKKRDWNEVLRIKDAATMDYVQ